MNQKITLMILVMALGLGCEPKKEDDISLEGDEISTSCFYSTNYRKASAQFRGGNYKHTSFIFTDSSCSQLAGEISEIGTYSIGSSTSQTGATITQLDLTLNTVTITAKSSSAVTNYNQLNKCGFSDWVIDVAKNVSGLNCGGAQMPVAGTTVYNIYGVVDIDNGSTVKNGDIVFGSADATNDGSTSQKRFTQLLPPGYRR